MKTFNVVIATAGRDTLQRMVDSIAPQLSKRDYLTFLWDCQPTDIHVESDCKVIYHINPEPLGYWGHGSRTYWQDKMQGDYLMNADDDDVYLPNAMEDIREHCREDKLYIFQMTNSFNYHIPSKHVIEIGNIGTPCGVYRPHDLPEWPLVYGGDFMFYDALSKTREFEFINKAIYYVKP